MRVEGTTIAFLFSAVSARCPRAHTPHCSTHTFDACDSIAATSASMPPALAMALWFRV